MATRNWQLAISNTQRTSLFFLSLLFYSCASGKLYVNAPGKIIQEEPSEIPSYTIYALGDAGEANDQSKTVMQELAKVSKGSQHPSMVIFLGDNIYPAGLPPEQDKAYNEARNILLNQINDLSSFGGNIVFIPGNHDWNEFKKGGLDAIRRQGNLLDQHESNKVNMLPENGCGGPALMELNNDVVMLIIDSQWWIQDWSKEPQMNEDCSIQSKEEFIKEFRAKVALYKDKQIVVAMHHPFYTQGNHGGHYSIKDHIFPLTAAVDWLYLPLPIIGSIYPYYRSVIGSSQDLPNRRYKSLREAILDDLDYDGEMIFLSGHEHCLQYIIHENDHFLISGAGSKQTEVADHKELVYGHKSGGFMKLDFYRNKVVWLTVYEVDPNTMTSKIVFGRPISQKGTN